MASKNTYGVYKAPALETNGAELSMLNDSGKFSPRNDQSLHDMLHIFVSKNNLKFTVFIETPSKSFSDWSFRRTERGFSQARMKHRNHNMSSPILSPECRSTRSNRKHKANEMEEESVFVDENMENMVRKVLGHIAWLLEEVQKPDSDSQKWRKNHGSSSSLAEKSDTTDSS
ncbi:hypothetical protein GLOIN_2v1658885 [Rhizophagus irregularis DAOM 181602=DAOM 197198]|nr:hypothetical protein GLOIN_2v1658885 [Rhizophagus irregularis DAOM 181602=DAOM 197198]